MADPPDDRAPAAVSTMTRGPAAIGEGHKAAGQANPCTNEVICVVRAWRAWLAASGLSDGPAFRSVDHHGRLGERRLSD